nr:LapA family protein [Legionella pneumophila]
MRILMLVTYLLLIIIGVSFAALNASSVQVNFYFKTVSMPISVLMTIMLGVGVFI